MTLISNISTGGMAKLKATYQYVFLGIVTAIIGSAILFPYAAMITGWTFWGLVIAEFVMLFAFMFNKNIFTYLAFTTLTGMTLVPVLAHYVSAGMSGVILEALIGTGVLVLGLTHYALTTDKTYLSMGQTLFYILLGIVVISIVNIFIGSSILALIISIVAMILFSFFIIHDTQQVLYTDVEPLDAAMNLYLDILNIFTSLLQILGFSWNND